jgi:signal transduction histidine kinase
MALWVVSWAFFAVVTITLATAVLVEPGTLARRAVTVAVVGAFVAILHAISRTGRPLIASWMLVIGLTLIGTERAWGTGGINAPVPVFYVLFIMMAGVLIGPRGGIATAAVAVAGAVLLTVATSLRWLTPRPGGSPIGGLLLAVLAIGLAVLIQALIATQTRRQRLRPDVAAMLAHDMRSPMHALLAHLEFLRDEVRGNGAADVDGAIRGVNALSRMTESFIDAGRLEAGELQVRRAMTDLSAVARSVVEHFHVIQRTREMSVDASGDVRCACDPDLTRRIIENLVGNAMKHTNIAARVRVLVEGAATSVSIVVRDEGAGVPVDQRGRIFEPYVSAGDARAAADIQSSGIGLAFCRLAAEAQGGTIRIDDSALRGSAFVVELPR